MLRKPETFWQRFAIFSASAVFTGIFSFAISYCMDETGLNWGENGRLLFAIPGGVFSAALVHARGSWVKPRKSWILIVLSAIVFGFGCHYIDSTGLMAWIFALTFVPLILTSTLKELFDTKTHPGYLIVLVSVGSALIPVYFLEKKSLLDFEGLLTISFIFWQLGIGALMSYDNPLAEKENFHQEQNKLINQIGKDSEH